jgi:DNA repair exonuclease SbcCD nuclease subunit
MRKREVDLIVVAGDLIEQHPSAADIHALLGHVRCMADVAPVVIVKGNHDGEGWLELCEGMETTFDVAVATRPMTLSLVGYELRPGVDTTGAECVIHCLPWTAKGHLLAMLDTVPSPEESDCVVRHLLGEIFTGFRTERDREGYFGPSILVCHCEVGGAVMDSGQPNVSPGFTISEHELESAGATAIMLGHIHKRQSVGFCTYAGSPARLTWGEAGPVGKGWILWELNGSEHDGGKDITVPGPNLWTVESVWAPDEHGEEWGFAFEGEPPVPVPPAKAIQDELRFRYHVPSEQRAAAKAAVTDEIGRIWHGPIERVTIEEVVIPSEHARAPEVATESDPVEQAKRWLRLEHPDWDEDRVEEMVPYFREAVAP